VRADDDISDCAGALHARLAFDAKQYLRSARAPCVYMFEWVYSERRLISVTREPNIRPNGIAN
jgi:hypothetical protein